jgi:uncharacterized protein
MNYIDTSVLVAYYWPEKLSSAAQAEICRTANPSISPLTIVEFTSALAFKIRINEMDEAMARRILSLFHAHCSNRIYRVVSIEAREYSLACEWLETFQTSLRALDALHLAVAYGNSLRLITSDKILAESAKRLKVKYKRIK